MAEFDALLQDEGAAFQTADDILDRVGQVRHGLSDGRQSFGLQQLLRFFADQPFKVLSVFV